VSQSIEQYFYGQGKILIARRTNNGTKPKWRRAWDVSALTLALAVESFTHKESMTGQKEDRRKIITGRTATANMTMHNIDTANLALTLHGEENVVVGGSITGESLPAALEIGDIVLLDHPGVSNLVLTDSSGTPATLDEEHYHLDPAYGHIEILGLPSGPAPTQPFKAAYTHSGLSQVGVFAATPPEIMVRYNGINLAENGAAVVVDLWRMATDPLSELALINNDQALAGMPLSATILSDAMQPVDSTLGRFGRIAFVNPIGP